MGRWWTFGNEVRWFDKKPLFGKRVLVTRSRTQMSVLSEMLAEEGAEPIELPTIEFSDVDDYSHLDSAITLLHSYSWVIFTSANGVEAFFGRVKALRRDSRVFGGVKVAAIGPATAEALARHGIMADLVPDKYVSEAIVQRMESLGLKGARVLLPRADIGRQELADGLARLGAQVEQVCVYRTVVPQDSRREALGLLGDGNIDMVTFTSSSTVRNLLDLLDGNGLLLQGVKVACIGPITAGTARELGLQVDIVAQEYTIPGLVRAMREHFIAKEVG